MNRNILILAVSVLLMFGLSGSSCNRCGAKKQVSAEEASHILATRLCEKHSSCQQGGMEIDKENCIKEITTGLTERLKQKTDLTLTSAILDGCTKTIVDSNCEILNSEAPPPACEFLQ